MNNNEKLLRYIKLKNGDDLIAYIEGIENLLDQFDMPHSEEWNFRDYDRIRFHCPLVVVYMMNPSNMFESRMTFKNWISNSLVDFKNQTVDISANDILTMVEVRDGCKKYYLETVEYFTNPEEYFEKRGIDPKTGEKTEDLPDGDISESFIEKQISSSDNSDVEKMVSNKFAEIMKNISTTNKKRKNKKE